jgi:Ni/Fe-hydrogenase 1 B-type cytochrome subunit
MISSLRPDKSSLKKVKKYSASLRFWHWSNVIVIGGSLLTILINSTVTENSGTAELLKTSLKKSGAEVSDSSIASAAQAISDNVWFIHVYFGYALITLFVFRLFLEFFQLAEQKLMRRLKNAYTRFSEIKKTRQDATHELFVKTLYSAFYLLLLMMATTGLFIGYGGSLAIYETIISGVRSVHGFGLYLILAFVIVHLAGVFIAERKNSKGVVSDMVNGGSESL